MLNTFRSYALCTLLGLLCGCGLLAAQDRRVVYSGTVINVPESMRLLDCFPSANLRYTLRSLDGEELEALIRHVNLAQEVAEIFVGDKTYTVNFALFDEASQQTLRDWGIKNALNRNLSLGVAEINGRSVRIAQSEPFKFQKPPVGVKWSNWSQQSRLRTVGFRLRSSAPVDIENVDILIGVRTRRTMVKDVSRFYPASEVAGRYFTFTNVVSRTIAGDAENDILAVPVVHTFGQANYGAMVDPELKYHDRFDSCYILVLYKGELVFGGISNTASLRVALAQMERFLAGEENPEFEIIKR